MYVAISAGGYHSLALHRDGLVVAWGNNANGQAEVPPGLSNVVAISAGGDLGSLIEHNLALRSDGTVIGWGGDLYGQADVPVGRGSIAVWRPAPSE